MSESEPELVAKVAGGDRAAFAHLLTLHLVAIESFAQRTLGDPSRAQDVAQEVMLRLWQQADRFDPSRARLSTWLHQIAHNLCMDQFRQGARFTQIAAAESIQEKTEIADDEEQGQLQRALALLPERHRTALALTYYQSLSNREAAEVMGLSVRALESLLVRARRSLREIMED